MSSKSTSSSAAAGSMKTWDLLVTSLAMVGFAQLLYLACQEAYEIRLYAIKEFGKVIHEFDPYFNFRATVYLHENGWKAFSQWFDYLVWYPLGRPVGTTIYPGMQVTSVLIKEYLLKDWSLNDICCMVPAWFGVSATCAVAGLAYSCSRQTDQDACVLQSIPGIAPIYRILVKPLAAFMLRLLERVTGSTWGLTSSSPLTPVASAVAAACIMAVVPAHLLRSIAGGYDNESIAMTAMVTTFFCWTLSLQPCTGQAYPIVMGCLTGVAYFYMVAAWGGYVFVLNLIGVHAGVLVALGRYSTKLHRAYTCFYLVGTALAIQVPVVGWTPLKSLEQMGPLVGFLGLQLLEICAVLERRGRYKSRWEVYKMRVAVFGVAAMLAVIGIAFLGPTGYFGPISSRVRGLFVKHTKTGNPLVDSVAEHQAASPEAYFSYLQWVCYVAPVGLFLTAAFYFNDASSFLLVYGFVAFYFSHRMVRLILLTAPIASVCAGMVFGRVASWAIGALLYWDSPPTSATKPTTNAAFAEQEASKNAKAASKKNQKKKKSSEPVVVATPVVHVVKPDPLWVRGARLALAGAALYYAWPHFNDFYKMGHEVAKQISHPTIIQKARTKSGEIVMVDDYREAYLWLSDNTPEDARIMAWWDYGYQITAIGNRTTIADGNTWNHEHIALLGRILTSPEKEAHRIARHLADYVLVWTGGGGDDVAKSPHLRRIANSVYRGLCREPTCGDFGFYSDGSPSKDMGESLLYKLHSNGLVPGVEADRNRFKEVFRSRYAKVRIYKIMSVSKESKEWVVNPENRLCDAPGSWFCPGQYPPALTKILKDKKDFRQLEDFNVKGDDSEYQREYFENLLGDKKKRKRPDRPAEEAGEASKIPEDQEAQVKKLQNELRLPPEEINLINENWENTEETTLLWELIANNRLQELGHVLKENPKLAHIRSEDGRGPMFWAHENGRKEIVNMLRFMGVNEKRKDDSDLTALDISKIQ